MHVKMSVKMHQATSHYLIQCWPSSMLPYGVTRPQCVMPSAYLTVTTGQLVYLTHWGRVTHICVSKLTIIGSDNGLLPGRHQAIIWTKAGIWSIEPLGTNFNRNSNIFIQENAFESVVCEMAAMLSRPQCVNHTIITSIFFFFFEEPYLLKKHQTCGNEKALKHIVRRHK